MFVQSETQPDLEESENAAFQDSVSQMEYSVSNPIMPLQRANTEQLRQERESQLPLPTPATEKLLADQFRFEHPQQGDAEPEREPEVKPDPIASASVAARSYSRIMDIELPPGWEDESDTSEIPPLFDSDGEQIIVSDDEKEEAQEKT